MYFNEQLTEYLTRYARQVVIKSDAIKKNIFLKSPITSHFGRVSRDLEGLCHRESWSEAVELKQI